MNGKLERCTPEQAGIPSAAVTAFLDDIRQSGIELHSFMLLRRGKVFAEGWWKPYRRESLHPLYSFTKSLTSTAIGFMEQEGLVSLDEKVVDIFPEEMPDNPSDNLKKCTVKHLLTMTCGHATEPKSYADKEWLRAFFSHPFDYEPGTRYVYNSMGTTVLITLLKKRTGKNLTSYLKPRLLTPLGIDDFRCSKLADGTEFGGGGGLLTTESMAKFMQFYLNRGVWNGKQLLWDSWFDRATAKQVETYSEAGVYPERGDWARGYGFQFWRNSVDGSYRADGMFGQFGLVYPGHDMVAIITETETNAQRTLDHISKLLHAVVDHTPETDVKEEILLGHRLDNLSILALWPSRSKLEERISGIRYEKTRGSKFSFRCMKDVLQLGLPQRKGAMGLSITFNDTYAQMEVDEGGKADTFKIGLCGVFADTEIYDTIYSAVGRWRSDTVFEIELRPIETCGGVRFLFAFTEKKLFVTREYIIPGMSGEPEVSLFVTDAEL